MALGGTIEIGNGITWGVEQKGERWVWCRGRKKGGRMGLRWGRQAKREQENRKQMKGGEQVRSCEGVGGTG
jgi:hypothetical protein